MYFLDNAKIETMVLHHVGNKQNGNALVCSNAPLQIDEDTEELLKTYFLSKFKSNELYNLTPLSEYEPNEVFSHISEIFEGNTQLHSESVKLAEFLYEQCTHPKIKSGEFYVVHFKGCVINKKGCDAIGLFKSENKETFLRVFPKAENFAMQPQEGINIKKLDKGCIIFNSEKENGYIATIVDNTNKNLDAKYWIDDFLQATVRKDDFFQTKNTMEMYKQYVTNQLPEEFDMNRVDQADLLNKTIGYFKNKENFQMDEFQQEVLQQPEVIDSFDAYRTTYENDYDLNIPDNFNISENAVKTQNRNYKSVIKLDKNFHIYVHGDRSKIEHGEDHKGKFYKLYFDFEK